MKKKIMMSKKECERVIERTYRFPGGSLIFYSYSGFGEIVLYHNKKIVHKMYGEIEELEKNWDNIIQNIEQDFVDAIVKRIGIILFKEINEKGGTK